MVLYIKKLIAVFCLKTGICKIVLKKLNKKYKNNYVRVLNYHFVPKESKTNFEKELDYLKDNFSFIDYDTFKKYLKGKACFGEKPAILFTFDDGKYDNYSVVKEILNKHNIKACFFVSSEKVINDDIEYMKVKELKKLIEDGHSIGCHTSSHYRFKQNDSNEKIKYEVIDSKKKLESLLNVNIDSFCWVGGEEKHYTKSAFNLIKGNYDYVFCTCSQVVMKNSNAMFIQRTNVESFWDLDIIKLQVSGIWDYFYIRKKDRIKKKLMGDNKNE